MKTSINNWWKAVSKRDARLRARLLTAYFLIGAGVILYTQSLVNAITTFFDLKLGVGSYQTLGAVFIVFGLLSLVLPITKLGHFIFITMPVMVYMVVLLWAALSGEVGWTLLFVMSVLYIEILLQYWEWR